MNSRTNFYLIAIIGMILVLSINISFQSEAKSLNQQYSKLAKRAITEWRFKRLNAQHLISIDQLFDISVEFKPKNYDGTGDDLDKTIKYKIKLIPEQEERDNADSMIALD